MSFVMKLPAGPWLTVEKACTDHLILCDYWQYNCKVYCIKAGYILRLTQMNSGISHMIIIMLIVVKQKSS